MAAILRITDGTTEINLLKGQHQAGFHLARWRPVISPYKGGGTWQDSPLSDGRQLVDRKFEDAIETLDLKLVGASQDEAIYESRLLRVLLEKAADYWTGWQDEPVWLEAKGTCETNPRYAIIHTGQIAEDGAPFQQPFIQADGSAVMDNLTLVVERGPWLSCQPGTGAATAASALEDYDGRNLGNVDSGGVRQPTTADEVYLANKRNVSNLTDVRWWDAATAAWSPVNLMDAALPFALFLTPAAGDVIIFGTDNTIADSGPFCSLVFDLLTAQTDLSITWRYSRTGADVTLTPWPALTVQDNTNDAGAMTGQPLNTAGVGSVHWEQPSDWAPFNPTVGGGAALGVTGLWVAAHVTAVGGAPAAPVQQNRDIYSIVWPYAEVQAAAVGGDVPALLRMKLTNTGDKDIGGGAHAPELYANRVIVGLRSYDRGANFTAYLNLADEQNPAGVSVALSTDTTFQNDVTTASGRYVRCTFATDLTLRLRAVIYLDATIVPNFYGTYHAFLRARQVGGNTGDVTLELRVCTRDMPPYWTSNPIIPDPAAMVGAQWQLLDLGQIHIPDAMPRLDEVTQTIDLRIYASAVNSTPDLYLYDLILIPVDEWAAEFYDSTNNAMSLLGDVQWDDLTGPFRRYLDADSLRYPKKMLRSPLKLVVDDSIAVNYSVISSGPAILQSSARQRLWFLTAQYNAFGLATWVSEPWPAHSIQLERVQRYLSMRGAG